MIGANLLLGVNQGLVWSMTVNMKMDLAGPRWRGVVLGFNESAGYLSLAVMAFLTGVIADSYGLRPEPFYLGIGIAAGGLALSALFIRDTAAHLLLETVNSGVSRAASSFYTNFAAATWRRPELVGITQAGLVKNLNDGVAWGIFPLYYADQGLSIDRIAVLVAVYPLVWGVLQLATGWASDILGRKPLIVTGMVLQGVAISLTAGVDSYWNLDRGHVGAWSGDRPGVHDLAGGGGRRCSRPGEGVCVGGLPVLAGRGVHIQGAHGGNLSRSGRVPPCHPDRGSPNRRFRPACFSHHQRLRRSRTVPSPARGEG